MKTKQFSAILATFFLVLFASTKVFGLHEVLHNHSDHHGHHDHDHNHDDQKPDSFGVFGHFDNLCDQDNHDDHDHETPSENQDQEDDCQLCDKILLDYFASYSGAGQSIDSEEITPSIEELIVEEYTSEIHTTELSTVLFSRPPPALS